MVSILCMIRKCWNSKLAATTQDDVQAAGDSVTSLSLAETDVQAAGDSVSLTDTDDQTTSMSREGEDVTDVYRLPPMEVKAYDDWQHDQGPTDYAPFHYRGSRYGVDPGDSDPSPDYSDDDDAGGGGGGDDFRYPPPPSHVDVNPLFDTGMLAVRRQNVQEQLQSLYKDEFDDIVEAADSGVAAIDIPTPDYLEEDGQENGSPLSGSPQYSSHIAPGELGPPPVVADGVQVEPKKLVNPVTQSRQHQELHRELLLNSKLGVDVLKRKPELKKVYERRQDTQKKKEREDHYREKRSSFEKKLEEQAQKLNLEEQRKHRVIEEEKETPEFLKMHSKIYKTSRAADS